MANSVDIVAALREVEGYREVTITPSSLFRNYDPTAITRDFGNFRRSAVQSHIEVQSVLAALALDQYPRLLRDMRFVRTEHPPDGSHCHQQSPVAAAVLHALGYRVTYLECKRILPGFADTGRVVPVRLDQLPDEAQHEEWRAIGRIPYCCIGVQIMEQWYYCSPKHITVRGGVKAGLSPTCYIPALAGASLARTHQCDPSRSGIYLAPVTPRRPTSELPAGQFVWHKQKLVPNSCEAAEEAELFATFVRFTIVGE